MGEWLQSIWDTMVSFFDWITCFFTSGIVDLVVSANDYFIGKITVWKYSLLTWSIDLVSGRISAIFDGISYQAGVLSAWSNLPDDVVQTLSFFNVPEAVALITGAYGTRFIIGLIPYVR